MSDRGSTLNNLNTDNLVELKGWVKYIKSPKNVQQRDDGINKNYLRYADNSKGGNKLIKKVTVYSLKSQNV